MLTTTRVGLTLWEPGDNVQGEEAWNVVTRQLEANVALLSDVQQPFFLKSATYDNTNNRLVLTIAQGSADFLGTLVSTFVDTVRYVAAPAINTAYRVFVKSDGSFPVHTGAALTGEVGLWQVATGAALATITTTDLRGKLAGAAARKVADDLAAHQVASDPHSQYALDTDLAGHVNNLANPHSTTASQVGAITGVGGVVNAGGQVALAVGGAITVTPDNSGAKKITIGESHSPRTDNPHGTTAAQTGALVSVKGVSNPGGNIDLIGSGIAVAADDAANTITLTATALSVGALASIEGVSNAGGNIDLVGGGAITIQGDDAANSITITESHSLRTDNPHGTTAAQVGALTSIEGVSNAGGNIDLVQGGAITIVGDDAANTITISETHSTRVDNPHGVTATQVGALASIDGVFNAGGNVDLVAGANITITPDDTANTITFAVTGTVPTATNSTKVGGVWVRSNAGKAEVSVDNATWNPIMTQAEVTKIAAAMAIAL